MRKIAFLFSVSFVFCLPARLRFILMMAGGLPAACCFSQAYQFTQFYAAPTFLNPAFAGSGVCQRVTTNYRMQWPSVSRGYRTFLLAFDNSIPKKHSGVGFLLTNDRAGSGSLRSTSFNTQYAYQLMLNRTWMFCSGFEAGFAIRNYDFDKYIFGDQIAYGTAATTVEQPEHFSRGYLDLGSGALFYSEKNWVGLSARHINRPNQALVTNKSPLPVLYSLHGGRTIQLVNRGEGGKDYSYVTFAFNYRAEKKFDQVDLGFYYSTHQFVVGMWYRGIPLFKAYKKGYPNNDMLALLLGTTIDRFKFGYSYDITISWLAGNTAGAHEISLSYQFCKRTMKSSIPCPKF